MTKETSAEVASMASLLLGLNEHALAKMAREQPLEFRRAVHAVAASALAQREVDPAENKASKIGLTTKESR